MNKIVHLTFSLEVGGTENLLVDIANTQADQAFVSIVIVNNQYDKMLTERISKDINVLYVGRRQGTWSLGGLLRIWKWLWRYKPDIIHCHQHNLIRLLPFWRSKAVMTVHDVGIPTGNLKKYKKVFSISTAVQRDLLERGRIPSSVIYNGILMGRINRKNSWFYSGAGVYKVVQVSRLHHDKKGQHIAIKALKRLHENGYPNIHLYFIGEGPSLPYLKMLARELHLEQNIFFLGPKERAWIYEHLSHFDLLVQPSLYEGFGLSIIEGIAAGLPVIASGVDGPAEILKGIPSGFLFNSRDEGDLAGVIKKVIDLTLQNKIQELCSASFERICQQYSVCQTANSYLRSYATT